MKILVACEESQAVCKAFRARGHEAYSADIQEPSGGHPEWHILGDVLPLIDGDCTFRTMDGQPWYFGEDYQKTTCLWLIGLPKLIPTVTEKNRILGIMYGLTKKTGKQKRQTQWYYDTRCQGKRRGKVASKTPQGLANAMAEQWGVLA